MKRTVPQSTKREMQAAARSPLLWAALAAGALVLGLAGPFGTYEALPLPARLAYWGFVAVITYFTGFASVAALNAAFPSERGSLCRYALFGALGGVPVALAVWLVNLWVFADGGLRFPTLLGYVVAVSAIASGTIALFSRQMRNESPADTKPPAAALPEKPPLLDRLPPHLRGRLRYLSMQDHYVEVVTDKGSHLVLMRMSDAIAETSGTDGMQIHRSHWVARDAVVGAERRGERTVLRLVDGTELPVSRSKLGEVRKAGLRP